MVLENIVLEILVVMFSALFSFIVCYLAYESFPVAVWGYIAAYLPRIPISLVTLSGGTNLTIFSWLSHSIGILLFPAALAVADILLLEIALVRIAKPVSLFLPGSVKTAIKVESFLSRLQDYHAVPRPVRVQYVYGAGVIAGIINLLFVLSFGLL